MRTAAMLKWRRERERKRREDNFSFLCAAYFSLHERRLEEEVSHFFQLSDDMIHPGSWVRLSFTPAISLDRIMLTLNGVVLHLTESSFLSLEMEKEKPSLRGLTCNAKTLNQPGGTTSSFR